MPNDPQVPWTDEQWACVNQVIQEEAKRARIAATFLPLYGPLPADSDYVRDQPITYPPMAMMGFPIPGREQLNIGDRDTIRLATLQVTVPVRNAQMADPELSSALALFRRAANVVARLEDAVVFRGLAQSQAARVALGDYQPPGGLGGLPDIWQITGASGGGRTLVNNSPAPMAPRPRAARRTTRQAIGARDIGRHRLFWSRADTSARSRSCSVRICFLSRKLRTGARSSCRRIASSRFSAAARCSVPRPSTSSAAAWSSHLAARPSNLWSPRTCASSSSRLVSTQPSSSAFPRRSRFVSGSLTRSSNFIRCRASKVSKLVADGSWTKTGGRSQKTQPATVAAPNRK